MMNIQEALKQNLDSSPKARNDRERLVEKEILLADLLKKDRSFLHSHPEIELTQEQELQFIDKLKRRTGHEPIAYLLGYQEFWGRKFLVNKDVLIPRADTEMLVQEVLHYADNKPMKVVDVGTGSGCIAITLKLENPLLNVIATEISKEALEVAKKNARLHKAKIEFIETNLIEGVETPLDIIIANLPYIPTKNWEKLPLEIKTWEPRVSLESWDSKTTLYKQLFDQAKTKLKPGGKIFYEVDGVVYKKLNR